MLYAKLWCPFCSRWILYAIFASEYIINYHFLILFTAGKWFVYTCQQKTNRGQDNDWSMTLLSEAPAEIRSGQLKTSVASRAYSIPETMQRHYLKCQVKSSQWMVVSFVGYSHCLDWLLGLHLRSHFALICLYFTRTHLSVLCNYMLKMSWRGFDRTQQRCSLAYKLAWKNNT